MLYSTLVLQYLSYCVEVWGNTYDSRLNKLVKLQKRAMRIIDGVNYLDPTNGLFIKYKCMKFKDIIKLKTCCQVYKASRNVLPSVLQVRYRKTFEVHSYSTRNCTNIYQNKAKSTMKNMCPSIKGVTLFNELPADIANSPSLEVFKNKLKKYLIKTYRE